MRNNSFRVRVIKAQNQIIELFAHESSNLIICQRARILNKVEVKHELRDEIIHKINQA